MRFPKFFVKFTRSVGVICEYRKHPLCWKKGGTSGFLSPILSAKCQGKLFKYLYTFWAFFALLKSNQFLRFQNLTKIRENPVFNCGFSKICSGRAVPVVSYLLFFRQNAKANYSNICSNCFSYSQNNQF